MNRTVLLILCCASLLVTGWAQAPDKYKGCSPVGIWYGETYVLTVSPNGGEEFTIRYEPVYDVTQYGYKAWTSWPGQLLRKGANSYRAQAISMFTTTTDVIELDGVRGWMEFSDCKNIQITYDFFGGYFDLSKQPFVDTPEVDYMPPDGLIENYHRMPTQCPACQQAHAAVSQPRQKR